MGSKKAKKDCKAKSHTSPRKQKATRDAEPEEESQEQSQEQSQEPEPRDQVPEGDAAGHGDGDGEKTEKVGTVWTPEQDEQPFSRIIRCFTIWPILNTRTRRSEKICYWIWPGTCSKVVSVTCFPVSNLLRNVVHFLFPS